MASETGGYASDQPTALYLDAVVAYAFRGPACFHVPGHKGGPGADPGVRKAIGVDGLVLSGGVPSFVTPEYDAERGITHCVTPAALEQALREAPDAKAAFVVSPTYFGMAADVAGLAQVARAAGVPLVVDQSWGPHFGFHDGLPSTALSQGADAMLTSTHKIAGSLTQSAMLHVGDSDRIDAGAIGRALRLLRSTSPSSLLIASLDGARRQLALHGEQLLHETLEAIDVARAKLQTIEGIALVDASLIGQMGVAGYDPLRIVLDVRGTGLTGYEIADALRRSYDVHVELPMQATVVFVVGIGESVATLRRVAGDVEETVKRLAEPGATAPIVPPQTSLRNEMALPPREAFLGVAEQVAVDAAVGRISCESIASYPPGVPALLPGERISAETVAYLRELAAAGARLHGASDPQFETINVLQEAEPTR